MSRIISIALLVLAGWPAMAGPCQATHAIASGDSLDGLSEFYFGDGRYASAILLATNARAAEPGFQYIANPDAMPAGKQLCIPDLQEAERLRLRYETYLKAIEDMILPEPTEVSDKLLAIDRKKPVRVLSWMRPDEANAMKEAWRLLEDKSSEGSLGHVGSLCEIFLPKLQHGPWQSRRAIGAPVGAEIGNAARQQQSRLRRDHGVGSSSIANIFRPCSNPSVETTTCLTGPPAVAVPESHRTWFFTQYYRSYATARPS